MRKALLLSLPLLVAGLVAPAAADGTVTVSSLGGDWHEADTRLGGSHEFKEVGGVGALQMATDDTNAAKAQTFTDNYDGLTLNDITSLSYTSWRDSSSTGFVAGSVALNIVVDFKTADGSGDTYLVYEPYQDQGNAAVLTDRWQTWDAINGGNATWWINGAKAGGCGQSDDCTWDEVKAIIGDAPLTPETAKGFQGSLGLNLGSYNAGLVTAVDTLAVNGTTYDFGPKVYGKNDCKNGGFADAGHKRAFKNQGACVSFYAKA